MLSKRKMISLYTFNDYYSFNASMQCTATVLIDVPTND